MQGWERLQAYLTQYDKGNGDFSVYEYVATRPGMETWEGSNDIQDYLRVQRNQTSNTLYVLHRVPGTRTRGARWAVGVREQDARAIGRGLFDDVRARVVRAFQPDLNRLAQLNPQAKVMAEGQIDAVLTGALKVLEVAATGSVGVAP